MEFLAHFYFDFSDAVSVIFLDLRLSLAVNRLLGYAEKFL